MALGSNGFRFLSASAILGAVIVAGPLLVHGQDKSTIIPTAGAGAQAPAPAPGPASSFDQPLAWLLEAKRNFTAVQDYSCTITKQENIGGGLSDAHIISAKFRTQPFSVYMKWLAPSKIYGQELAFILGRNNNKLRVHSKGLIKGAVGFVSIDVNDRRVLEQSRHTIYEAGIGNLIEFAIKYVEAEKQHGKGQARVAEYTFDNRACYRVEIIRGERRQQYDYHRTVLYLDKEAKLPVRAENYDWPRQGGADGGELVEMVSYSSLRWNLGLSEREFNK